MRETLKPLVCCFPPALMLPLPINHNTNTNTHIETQIHTYKHKYTYTILTYALRGNNSSKLGWKFTSCDILYVHNFYHHHHHHCHFFYMLIINSSSSSEVSFSSLGQSLTVGGQHSTVRNEDKNKQPMAMTSRIAHFFLHYCTIIKDQTAHSDDQEDCSLFFYIIVLLSKIKPPIVMTRRITHFCYQQNFLFN